MTAFHDSFCFHNFEESSPVLDAGVKKIHSKNFHDHCGAYENHDNI